MRKWIIAGLLVLALFAGWFIASPWMALDSLRDAAREGDRQSLDQAIDYPALRESAKAELREEIAAEARRRGGDSALARIGSGLLASGLIDRVVDNLVTPDGMSALLVTGSVLPRDSAKAKEIDWDVDRVSFNTFRAFPKGEAAKDHPALIFGRDGLSWNLVGIDIP